MGVTDVVFGEDIVLNEEAFSTAVAEFEALSSKLKQLRTDIEEMLSILKPGFDTPAGRKLIAACESKLFEPLNAQELVLTHISDSLKESRQAYASVFQAYEELQTAIKQVNT